MNQKKKVEHEKGRFFLISFWKFWLSPISIFQKKSEKKKYTFFSLSMEKNTLGRAFVLHHFIVFLSFSWFLLYKYAVSLFCKKSCKIVSNTRRRLFCFFNFSPFLSLFLYTSQQEAYQTLHLTQKSMAHCKIIF